MQNVSEFSTPTPTNLNWLNIGQSFVLPPPETHTRKNIPNYLGEDLIEQSKKFFNVDKRKSAADYIDDQFSCSSEEKKLKSMKKVILSLIKT